MVSIVSRYNKLVVGMEGEIDYGNLNHGLFLSDTLSAPSIYPKSRGGILFSHGGELKFLTSTGSRTISNDLIVADLDKIRIGSSTSDSKKKSIAIGYNIQDSNNPTDTISVGKDILSKNYRGRESLYFGSSLFENIEDSYFTTVDGISIGKNIVRSNYNTLRGYNILNGDIQDTDYNVCMGNNLLHTASCRGHNVLYGNNLLQESEQPEYNILMGNDIYTKGRGSKNILLGNNVAEYCDSVMFTNNILFGNYAGRNSVDTFFSNNIGFGNQVLEESVGNILHCIAIGENALKKLNGSVLSYGIIALGADIGMESENIKDCILLGNSSAKKLKGSNIILMGSNSLLNTKGCVGNDIVIGNNTGNDREYSDTIDEESRYIFIGYKAGSGTFKNRDLMALGTEAGHNSNSNYSVYLGKYAGKLTVGDYNNVLGFNIQGNSGSYNTYIGSNINGIKGNGSLIITSSEKTYPSLDIDNSIQLNHSPVPSKDSIIQGNLLDFDNKVQSSILLGISSLQEIYENIQDITMIGNKSCNKSSIKKSNFYGHSIANESKISNSNLFGSDVGSYSTIIDSSIIGNGSVLGSDVHNSVAIGNNNFTGGHLSNSVLLGNNINSKHDIKDTFIVQDFLRIQKNNEHLLINESVYNTHHNILLEDVFNQGYILSTGPGEYAIEIKCIGHGFYIHKEFYVNFEAQKIDVLYERKIKNNVVCKLKDNKIHFSLEEVCSHKVKIMISIFAKQLPALSYTGMSSGCH